uniref:Spectrin beta chain n=1 Tax=Rhabditophanes sp. KR3021 TaxID=114890 RepID=A0AC35UII5_9BILA
MSRQSNQYSAGYGHNRVTSGDNYATYNNHPNGRVVNSPSNNSERPHSRASSQSTYAIPSQGPPPLDGDDPDNPTAYFEKNRIKSLQSERIGIQKKTFTKWCNSYLCRARLEIDDLFIDLGDGILLLKFLEIISGKKLQKPNRGHMRVQKIENLNNCFHFLKANGIQLTNIGAEDILDGNETLILGLIWVIILRFSISEIAIIDDLTGEKRQAKDALLQWCKVKVAPYSNVKMENFTSSWKNGLAFNALIHAHRPELINYSSLNGNDAIGTLNNAFEVAEKKLEIARLLDAEDISRHADEKSIVTYVSMYYHYFAKQKTEDTAARRVAKIVGNLMEQDRLEEDYEALSSDILTWIRNTITWLENDHLPPSLNGIQNELAKFNVYRVQERPPKYKEVGELEAKYFEIQTKRKALARKAYVPPGGRMIKDVQDAWAKLDTAENEKQMMLINELRRQERLEQCAMKFFKKAQIREQWIRTKFVAIESCESNKNVAKINESVKKIEALSAEIRPQVTKFTNLSKMATELENEHYHDYKNISKRDREITNEWRRLLYNLSLCEQELNGFNNLTNLLRDLDELENELLVIQKGLKGAKIGDHLLGVDYFLEQHNLLQSEIRAKQVLLHKYEKAGEIVSREKKDPSNVMSHKLVNVKSHYEKVQKLSQERSDELIKARRYFLFIQNFEEELGWIEEKNSICEGMLSKRDITTFQQTSKQFKFLDTEMQTHSKRVNELLEEGQKLLNIAPSKDDMRHKMDILQAKFDQLRRLTALLAKWIEDAERARRYFQDANEAESWINEKMPLAKSSDYGRDIANSESLLSRHKSLVEEIDSYKTDIQRLDEAAEKLANTQFTLSNDTPVVVTEDLEVPKIKVNFSYKGEGGNGPFSVQKDEIVALMEKSNDEWWRVLRQTGEEGYIPANHCKILPGEKVTITQQVQEASLATNSQDKVAITTRQEKINSNYRKLCRLAEKRRNLLIDATKMFKFYNECEAFKEWAKDTRVVLEEPIPQAHIEIYRIKFDRLTSDIKAKGGTQLKNINDMADALISDMHSQSDDIRDYKDQINLIWNDLQKLVKQKGIELEILEKVKNFTDDCTELQNWMSGKYALLQEQVDDNDLEGLRNMQRRYQNLERDLAPLKKKMADLKQIAEIIKKNHPEYADMVDKMIKDLSAHHERLLRHAEEKINSAKQGQEQQIFDRNANKLAIWLEKTSFSLQEPITANMSAEDLLKRHGELWNEIEAKQFEFSYLNDVGNRISNDNKHLEAIRARCHKLDTAYIGVKQNWERRKYDIEKLMDLRLFNLEAERIDACTKGHEAFLNLKDLGDSVEGID